MRRLIIATYLWATVLALGVGVVVPTLRRGLYRRSNLPKVYQEVLMPVVKIRAGNSIGSGVIIASGVMRPESCVQTHHAPRTTHDAYILTAAHVVGNNNEVQVIYYSYRRDAEFAEILKATVIITDTVKDLALLRCESGVPPLARLPPQRAPPVASLARMGGRLAHPGGALMGGRRYACARLAPREYRPYLFTEVYAVGCSLGLAPRPSEGILSALCVSAVNYWEISAPILPGNSGGGVFLKDTHELIGITVWMKTCYGQLVTTMAGVIPIQQIYEFLDDYQRTKELKNEGTTKFFRFSVLPFFSAKHESEYQSIRLSDNAWREL